MSHIVQIKTEVKDASAVEAAALALKRQLWVRLTYLQFSALGLA
jgi:hypothetical protein